MLTATVAGSLIFRAHKPEDVLRFYYRTGACVDFHSRPDLSRHGEHCKCQNFRIVR